MPPLCVGDMPESPPSRTALSIRTTTQLGKKIDASTSVPSSQDPYPEYPIRIPPGKQEKALELYIEFKLAQRSETYIAQRDHYSSSLIPSLSGHSRQADDSLSLSREKLSDVTESGSVASVVSFNPNQNPLKADPEITAFDGKVVRIRKRKRLTPLAKAKAALIRYLGSCQPCRARRVPCPLEHHDIQCLEALRLSKDDRLLPNKPESRPRKVQLSTTSQQYSLPLPEDVFRGIGQNPQLLQDTGNPPPEDVNVVSATNSHVPPEAKVGLQSHNLNSYGPLNLASSPRSFNFLNSLPDPLETDFTQPGRDVADSSKDRTPSTTGSPSTDFGNTASSSNDLSIEITAAVEAAYEAAYGPGPDLPSLLSKLQSIFRDVTCESPEPYIEVEDAAHNDGASEHGAVSDEAPSGVGQNPLYSGSSSTFLGIGSKPKNGLLDRKRKASSRIKTAGSSAKPSVRVLRRLRCHFNARHPHRYCVTRSTGDKYHVCSKLGYLTIAHLKQHNKSTHSVSRCTRCGSLFDKPEEMGEHSRAYPVCNPVLPDQWPGIDQAENINETIQERITAILTARGFHQLPQTTKDALNLWVSANITEYVSDSPTPQDMLELKNWYLMWLALFPGVAVPIHPFCDGPSTSSAEDGRFLEVFQTVVQEKIAARQMTAISPDLLNEILERLRETQVIVRTVSEATRMSALGAEGEPSRASNSSEDTPVSPSGSADALPSGHTQRPAKRPKSDLGDQSGSNLSFQSNRPESVNLEMDNFLEQPRADLSLPPTFHQDMNSFDPTPELAQSALGSQFSVPFNNQWLSSDDPWSSNMLRFTSLQQQQSSVPSFEEIGIPDQTGYMGTEFRSTAGPSLDINLDLFDQEWFESLEPSNLDALGQAPPNSYDHMSET